MANAVDYTRFQVGSQLSKLREYTLIFYAIFRLRSLLKCTIDGRYTPEIVLQVHPSDLLPSRRCARIPIPEPCAPCMRRCRVSVKKGRRKRIGEMKEGMSGREYRGFDSGAQRSLSHSNVASDGSLLPAFSKCSLNSGKDASSREMIPIGLIYSARCLLVASVPNLAIWTPHNIIWSSAPPLVRLKKWCHLDPLFFLQSPRTPRVCRRRRGAAWMAGTTEKRVEQKQQGWQHGMTTCAHTSEIWALRVQRASYPSL